MPLSANGLGISLGFSRFLNKKVLGMAVHVLCWRLGHTQRQCSPSVLTLVFTARCYASAVLAMGLYPSVSVCHKSEFCWNGYTNGAGFGVLAPFHPSYTVLKGNSIISKNKSTSLWNFVLNSGLRKFCHGISIVETCYQLSSRKVDAQSVINWTVVGQLSR